MNKLKIIGRNLKSLLTQDHWSHRQSNEKSLATTEEILTVVEQCVAARMNHYEATIHEQINARMDAYEAAVDARIDEYKKTLDIRMDARMENVERRTDEGVANS